MPARLINHMRDVQATYRGSVAGSSTQYLLGTPGVLADDQYSPLQADHIVANLYTTFIADFVHYQ